MTEINKELLPCPFCGSVDIMIEEVQVLEGISFSAGCITEHCMGRQSFSIFARRSDVIKAWNTRYNAEAAQPVDKIEYRYSVLKIDQITRGICTGKLKSIKAAADDVLEIISRFASIEVDNYPEPEQPVDTGEVVEQLRLAHPQAYIEACDSYHNIEIKSKSKKLSKACKAYLNAALTALQSAGYKITKEK